MPTQAVFQETFEELGWERCESRDREEGYDKIAFYADPGGLIKHAARMVLGGWTSKLGPYIDISHRSLECLSGGAYGTVAFYMRRAVT